MKLDNDLIYAILSVSEQDKGPGPTAIPAGGFFGHYATHVIHYHVRLCVDDGLIYPDALPYNSLYVIGDLTMKGHSRLANERRIRLSKKEQGEEVFV